MNYKNEINIYILDMLYINHKKIITGFLIYF